MTTLIKEKHLPATDLQLRGSVHYHPVGKHSSMQADVRVRQQASGVGERERGGRCEREPGPGLSI